MLDSKKDLGLSLLVMTNQNRFQPHLWPHFELRPPLLRPQMQPLRPLALLAGHGMTSAGNNPHLSPISPTSVSPSSSVNQHHVHHHHQFPEFPRETAPPSSSPTPTEGKLNYDWRKWRCNDKLCGLSRNIHSLSKKSLRSKVKKEQDISNSYFNSTLAFMIWTKFFKAEN